MPVLKPIRGTQLNTSHPLARGLVGCWPFNEGAGKTVFDLSGNDNSGTLNGNTFWTPRSNFGSALYFDGAGDYVDCGSDNLLSIAAHGAFSIVAWIRLTDKTADKIIVSRGLPKVAYMLWYDVGDDRWEFFVRDSGEGLHYAKMDSSPTTGQWYHIVGIWDGSEISIWEDGIKGSVTSAITTVLDDSNDNTYIGFRDENNTYFEGGIDHVMILNSGLLPSEIAQLYREPFCMFERVTRAELIGGKIVNLAGTSAALSSLGATAKAMRKVGGTVTSDSDVAALLNSIRGVVGSIKGLAAVDGTLNIREESLLEIDRDWIKEVLFNGMTANALKLGTVLSLGWFWVRIAGCSALYRGSSMGEIDFTNILAVAEQNACEISPPSYILHNNSSAYFYVIRRFNNCGYQEHTLTAAVKVSIDSNGNIVEPQPNNISSSKIEQVNGNKIQLVWFYCPLGQKLQPVGFNVYYDGQTGQIDYENPIATIGYKGWKFYSFQSSALEAGKYLFAIRAEDASGIENNSLARLRIQVDTANPKAIDILGAEGV